MLKLKTVYMNIKNKNSLGVLIMTRAEKEAKELFNSLSKDDLIELLVDSGFEVIEQGSGQVIYSDTLSGSVHGTFKTKLPTTNYEVGVSSFPVAC
jgi:predicted flavoprotein YhiN